MNHSKPEDFPELRPEHIGDARLHADRYHMMRSLNQGGFRRVMEVGVGLGCFSEFLIDLFDPEEFVGLDLFGMHHLPELWGKPSADIFQMSTHEEYFRRRLAARGSRVRAVKGDSAETLRRMADAGERYDLIYIDGDHTYEGVRRDAEQCARLVPAGRLLVFNDYVMSAAFGGPEYGVVRCVNELLTGGGWRVVGFALHRHMFCDIALMKTSG